MGVLHMVPQALFSHRESADYGISAIYLLGIVHI